MSKYYTVHWKDWPVYTVRLPPSLKIQLEDMSSNRKLHQSDILRTALELYFAEYNDSEVGKEATKIMIRQRDEQLKLEGPKDKFSSLLFPVRVRRFVTKMRTEWKSAGYEMTPYLFDELIAFVEEEKVVVAGNPKAETIYIMLDELLAELEEEKKLMMGM